MHHLDQAGQALAPPGRAAETGHHSRPQHAAEARESVRVFLDGLSPAVAARTAQHFLLLVSELVSNALRHAGAVSGLRLRATASTLTVEVCDPSPERPAPRTPRLDGTTGGFGWPMIRELAESLTVRAEPDGGKTVTAVLAR
ncbi:ATP-binding protein [Streptomyces sp. NPDC004959]|uniref:ATP-binding protein n=1 Tax=unclassified Streptomyces TaxID=2593676 RepID=UPI0004C9C5B6|nr:ATP-binding protein [Streptomyces sp. NRRL F-5630]